MAERLTDDQKARTAQDIFSEMHRQLRVFNSEVPASAERLDPVMRILMQMYADQLARLDRRIDSVWEAARRSLITSLAPESTHWPVPACTVIKCQLSDPVVHIDPHTKLFYKEKRAGGHTHFFSSRRSEKLLSIATAGIWLGLDDRLYDLSPSSTSGQPGDAALPSRLPRREGYELYVALRFDGMPSDFMGAALFLDGPVTLLKQVRWAQWYSGDAGGNFGPGTCFCPGLTSHIAEMIEPTQRGVLDWGGLRSSSDLFDFLEPNFVRLSNSFTSSWRPGPPGSILRSLASNSAIDLPPDADQLYWMRLDLPEGGDKEPLRQSLSISFDCFIAFNKEAHSVHKYTAGNRLMEIEIPDHVDSVLEIESVVDSNGRDYLPHHDIRSGQFPSYTIERQGDTLVFWFEFSAVDKLPPDSITVHYSTTEGINANGIDLGRIDQLHENHPGIASVTNVLPSAGAVPAKTEEQIVAEISSRLRNRDRALGFAEIEAWAQSFDPRIQSAECRKSVERAERGVRRCTAVRLIVSAEAFHSNDETDLLARRMRNFLKSRSPINSHFTVEVNKI